MTTIPELISAIMQKLGETSITLTAEDIAKAPMVSLVFQADGSCDLRIVRDPDPAQPELFSK